MDRNGVYRFVCVRDFLPVRIKTYILFFISYNKYIDMKKGSENTDILRFHSFPSDETYTVFAASPANDDSKKAASQGRLLLNGKKIWRSAVFSMLAIGIRR